MRQVRKSNLLEALWGRQFCLVVGAAYRTPRIVSKTQRLLPPISGEFPHSSPSPALPGCAAYAQVSELQGVVQNAECSIPFGVGYWVRWRAHTALSIAAVADIRGGKEHATSIPEAPLTRKFCVMGTEHPDYKIVTCNWW